MENGITIKNLGKWTLICGILSAVFYLLHDVIFKIKECIKEKKEEKKQEKSYKKEEQKKPNPGFEVNEGR